MPHRTRRDFGWRVFRQRRFVNGKAQIRSSAAGQIGQWTFGRRSAGGCSVLRRPGVQVKMSLLGPCTTLASRNGPWGGPIPPLVGQMNRGTSSSSESRSLSLALGDVWTDRIAITRAPSNTIPGCRPAQLIHPVRFPISTAALPAVCKCIDASLPSIFLSTGWGGKVRGKMWAAKSAWALLRVIIPVEVGKLGHTGVEDRDSPEP